jgi:activator of 2-hydroxyglutaryl-CoA dehydratase
MGIHLDSSTATRKRERAMAHYIGLDVGTGSTRACLIDEKGDILGVATKNIKTWHERADYYVSLAVTASNSGTIDRRHLVGMLSRRKGSCQRGEG